MKNVFKINDSNEIINRINNLTPSTQGRWGKMTVAQMLAHCNVTYELVYTDKHPKPSGLMKFILKFMVKQSVVGEKPYKKNMRTGPQFLVAEDKNFEEEKQRLIDYITKTQELGEGHFDNKESHSFGKLKKDEWNNLFYKHLNHHLSQFGV